MIPSKPGKLFTQMQGCIAELSKELGETKYNWGVSLHEIDSLRAERDSLSERVRKMTAECESLRAENERLTERVSDLILRISYHDDQCDAVLDKARQVSMSNKCLSERVAQLLREACSE